MSAEEMEQQSAEETAEVAEEATETEETADNEVSEEASEDTEATEQEAEEHPELTKARKVAEDQRKRAEKAEAELKRLKPKQETDRAPKKNDQALSEAQDDRITRAEERAERAELRAMGVTHPDDIEYVRGAAKRLGVDPAEAVSDELVAGKLERMREGRKTKEATPAPSKRGGSSGSTNVGQLADKVAAGGALPKDAALAEKVQEEIARRAQSAA